MKVLVCLMLACLALVSSSSLSCNCGWRNSGRIVGGKETGKNEYPWMVSLSNGCGGSIITPWHVLTAAHCTATISPSQMIVSVGMHYLHGQNEKMKQHRVSRFIQHPYYNHNSKGPANDISILVLASPINFNQFVGPVCMPSSKFDLLGKFVKVTGWGRTQGTGNQNVLNEVDLGVISNSECKRYWHNLDSRPTQICAYTAKKDSCNGDSGSALVYLDPSTNRYTQVALVSYGDPVCGREAPSVNTDVFAYIDWIKSSIAQSNQMGQICTKQ